MLYYEMGSFHSFLELACSTFVFLTNYSYTNVRETEKKFVLTFLGLDLQQLEVFVAVYTPCICE